MRIEVKMTLEKNFEERLIEGHKKYLDEELKNLYTTLKIFAVLSGASFVGYKIATQSKDLEGLALTMTVPFAFGSIASLVSCGFQFVDYIRNRNLDNFYKNTILRKRSYDNSKPSG